MTRTVVSNLAVAHCGATQTGNETIKCERLLQPDERVAPVGMDFPTFNPNYKYNADSKWWWVTTDCLYID